MSSATLIAAPYVRGAYAAGKLLMGFWDHWVPGANKTLTDLVNEWAAKEKIEAQIDYITSQGNKILLTVSAEAQAKTGHDIMVMTTWLPHANAELLEPVNDIMAPIIIVVSLGFGGYILAESSLSFLGLGLRPPAISWGVLLQEAQNVQTLAISPWLLLPAVPVIVVILAFNFLGDGLRDAADPYGV